jgi:hypothetical protein
MLTRAHSRAITLLPGLYGRAITKSDHTESNEDEEVDSDGEAKPQPPINASYSQTKKKARSDYDSKGRVICQVLEGDVEDMSIKGILERMKKIRSVAKHKKYKVPANEARFLEGIFLPPIHSKKIFGHPQ